MAGRKKRPVKKIDIHFAGLFDTVASRGAINVLLQISNTRSLKLHAIRKAKKVIQLVAADEHRKKFPPTDIKSTGTKGREIYLPGVLRRGQGQPIKLEMRMEVKEDKKTYFSVLLRNEKEEISLKRTNFENYGAD